MEEKICGTCKYFASTTGSGARDTTRWTAGTASTPGSKSAPRTRPARTGRLGRGSLRRRPFSGKGAGKAPGKGAFEFPLPRTKPLKATNQGDCGPPDWMHPPGGRGAGPTWPPESPAGARRGNFHPPPALCRAPAGRGPPWRRRPPGRRLRPPAPPRSAAAAGRPAVGPG